MEFSGLRKAGLGFLAFGVSFLFLSVMMFFDGGLMALGNLFLILGLVLNVGVRRSLTYFVDRKRAKATVSLLLGMCIVLYGLPIIGILFEVYGLAVILRGLFPGVLASLRSLWSTWFFP